MAEFNLQEEIQALSDLSLYQIGDELDVENMSPKDLENALDGAIEAIARNTEAIVEVSYFDVYRSLLK